MTQEKISSLLHAAREPLLSYEFFPPKDETGMETLREVVDTLRVTRPDFVSVTYGAGGSTRQRTLEICQELQRKDYNPVMHHLTCVGASRDELIANIDEIHEAGIRNIMALRGDPPRGETVFRPHPQGLAYAADLVHLIRERHPDISCGVAGYPEVHQEATSLEEDIAFLKQKIEAGADFITTQLFYDNDSFFTFEKACRQAGITVPILPGLLPPLSLKQLQRMTQMCQASLPETLLQRMQEAGDDPIASEQVGIDWTIEQIEGLLNHGVPGVHLYILNRSKAALSPALARCFSR